MYCENCGRFIDGSRCIHCGHYNAVEDNSTSKSTFIAVIIAILVVFVIGAMIWQRSPYRVVGEYYGMDGSYLKINMDGTCVYSEDDSTGTGTGTWDIKGDVIYIEVSNLGYTVYGDISKMKDGFLLKAKSWSWNDELFFKE